MEEGDRVLEVAAENIGMYHSLITIDRYVLLKCVCTYVCTRLIGAYYYFLLNTDDIKYFIKTLRLCIYVCMYVCA